MFFGTMIKANSVWGDFVIDLKRPLPTHRLRNLCQYSNQYSSHRSRIPPESIVSYPGGTRRFPPHRESPHYRACSDMTPPARYTLGPYSGPLGWVPSSRYSGKRYPHKWQSLIDICWFWRCKNILFFWLKNEKNGVFLTETLSALS